MSENTTHERIFGTTTNPCPDWCDSRPGHGYDTEDHTCVTRIHTQEIGGVTVDGRELAGVTLHAAENLLRDSGEVTVLPPMISVYSDGNDLTGPQARMVARMLVEAANKLDEIHHGEAAR